MSGNNDDTGAILLSMAVADMASGIVTNLIGGGNNANQQSYTDQVIEERNYWKEQAANLERSKNSSNMERLSESGSLKTRISELEFELRQAKEENWHLKNELGEIKKRLEHTKNEVKLISRNCYIVSKAFSDVLGEKTRNLFRSGKVIEGTLNEFVQDVNEEVKSKILEMDVEKYKKDKSHIESIKDNDYAQKVIDLAEIKQDDDHDQSLAAK